MIYRTVQDVDDSAVESISCTTTETRPALINNNNHAQSKQVKRKHLDATVAGFDDSPTSKRVKCDLCDLEEEEEEEEERYHQEESVMTFKRVRIISKIRAQRGVWVSPPRYFLRSEMYRGPGPSTEQDDNASLLPSVDRRISNPAAEWGYYFPGENEMLELEDLRHTMLLKLCRHVIFAPVHDNLNASAGILDIGTGTGAWALLGMWSLHSLSRVYI